LPTPSTTKRALWPPPQPPPPPPKEIAQALVVTVNTVEFHLRNAYAKLGVRSRTQLAARLAAGTPGGHRET
jgi:hypothetical protein